ncbi:tetratricopeptide repeat protein [Ramlibacter sp. AN1133]|uniref:tetratricopeptide repeat protein n=1 Tax=Ramlibacter sp. AN1133 TaxID=3133429 RepID=UPI0030BF2365
MAADGAALLAGGRFREAMVAYAQWLQREPLSVPARVGLARACMGAGEALSAAAWLSDAIRLAPDQAEPMQLLADLCLAQGQHAQALPLYLQLGERFGLRTAVNLLRVGFCEEQLGRIAEAAAAYREALAVDPLLVDAHVDLAGVLWRLEDGEGALAHAREAVRLAPASAAAQRILGTALLNLNRVDEAEAALRRALELQPGLVPAQVDLAFTLLLAGRWPAGWHAYEQRWRDARVKRPAFWRAEGEWPGPSASLAGQAIAVVAEQGRGDTLQFLRFVPQLQALGARVCAVVPPDLVPLVEASFDGVACLVPGRELRVQWHVALMDLAARLDTTFDTLPAQVPYLRPPQAARSLWRERLQPWQGEVKVGLAWCGSPVQVNDRNRSMPLSTLLPLARTSGLRFFSLQKEQGGEWTDAGQDALVDLTPHWQDFGDSAAMIEQMDLVLTVDTAIAHLAGALGKPVWILLGPNADWRWLLDRADSPWYPTARLFRRGFGEARAAQVERVRQALLAWRQQRGA